MTTDNECRSKPPSDSPQPAAEAFEGGKNVDHCSQIQLLGTDRETDTSRAAVPREMILWYCKAPQLIPCFHSMSTLLPEIVQSIMRSLILIDVR